MRVSVRAPSVILMKKSRYARTIWIHDLQLIYAYHRSDDSSQGRDCGFCAVSLYFSGTL
jgi:hypothetical protein